MHRNFMISLTNFDLVWCVTGLIGTRSNMVVTWKVCHGMDYFLIRGGFLVGVSPLVVVLCYFRGLLFSICTKKIKKQKRHIEIKPLHFESLIMLNTLMEVGITSEWWTWQLMWRPNTFKNAGSNRRPVGQSKRSMALTCALHLGAWFPCWYFWRKYAKRMTMILFLPKK